MTLDLNADLGESRAALDDGSQEQLLRYLTSANIACGGHAGDAETMRLTLLQCRARGVAPGAHPSYPDRENFGRLTMNLPPDALAATIAEQIDALAQLARDLGLALTHIKPHGALYNDAARDPAIAQAILAGTRHYPDLVLYGLRGSVMLQVFAAAGRRTAREIFADRAYQPDGSLRPRHLPGALLTDPAAAVANVRALAHDADTVCIHSDTPHALELAAAVSHLLRPL